MRYYRGSPPYYKDLGSPPSLTGSPMQKTWVARPTAGGGIAASQKPLGISLTHLLAARSQTQANPKCQLVPVDSIRNWFAGLCAAADSFQAVLCVSMSVCISAYTIDTATIVSRNGRLHTPDVCRLEAHWQVCRACPAGQQ